MFWVMRIDLKHYSTEFEIKSVDKGYTSKNWLFPNVFLRHFLQKENLQNKNDKNNQNKLLGF